MNLCCHLSCEPFPAVLVAAHRLSCGVPASSADYFEIGVPASGFGGPLRGLPTQFTVQELHKFKADLVQLHV